MERLTLRHDATSNTSQRVLTFSMPAPAGHTNGQELVPHITHVEQEHVVTIIFGSWRTLTITWDSEKVHLGGVDTANLLPSPQKFCLKIGTEKPLAASNNLSSFGHDPMSHGWMVTSDSIYTTAYYNHPPGCIVM